MQKPILTSLSAEFAKLQSLEDLNLSDNDFDEFPKAICELTGLKDLQMMDCNLKALPDEFANLQNLKGLNLSGNKTRE